MVANLYATIETADGERVFCGYGKGSIRPTKQVLKLELALAKLLSKVPMGWIRMNLIHLSKSAFDYAEAVYREDEHLIDPLVVKRKMLELDTLYGYTINPDRFVVGKFKNSLFNSDIPRAAAQGQAFADMGKIACELERFYLAEKKYPSSLPTDLSNEKVSADVVMGQEPYVFQKTSASFMLYSLAWDKLNNLGQIGETSSGMEDWVWPAADLPVPVNTFFGRTPS